MRLDKLLGDNTPYSRSRLKTLIKSGQAVVNGEVERRPEAKVDFNDKIRLCGIPVRTEQFIYIKMNKPPGILTATRDKRRTVLDLVPEQFRKKGLFPVGRLDMDTTGLLLLTDDGALAHKLLSPKSHVEKTYRVVLDGPLNNKIAEEFSCGLTLKDGTALKPAKLKIIGNNEALVTITEGKYHQIKRMFGLYSLGVLSLERTAFAGIKLSDNLLQGQCELLTNYELKLLKNAKEQSI